MRHSILRSLSLVSAVVACLAALAWSGARAAAAPVPANDALEQAMGEIQEAMKFLGKGINAESQDAALHELGKIQGALLSAKARTPDTAAGVDEKKRPEFVAEFRTMLLEALKFTCDAEIAVVNGKYKDAEGILRSKLGSLKSAGHDKFKGKD